MTVNFPSPARTGFKSKAEKPVLFKFATKLTSKTDIMCWMMNENWFWLSLTDIPTENLSPYLRIALGDDFEFPRDYTTTATTTVTGGNMTIARIHGMDPLSPSLSTFNVIDIEPRDFRASTDQYTTMDCFNQNLPIKMESKF